MYGQSEYLNIAKIEQSSHTPVGRYQRAYHFNWKERTQCNLSYLMFVSNVKILGQVVPKKSVTNISIFITLE